MAFMFGIVLFESIITGVIFSLIASPFVYIRYKKSLQKNRKEKLERQFCDILQLMSASLAAGSNIQNCFIEVTRGDVNISGNDYEIIRKEFENIQRLISLHISPQDAFYSFAKRTGSRDILSFSSALDTALCAGSNMVMLVRNTASSLRAKYDAEEEIKYILNLPKFNHRIMMVMPFVLIVMIKLLSPGYVSPLYNGKGRIIMVIVAMILLLSWYIGEKISDIKY